MHAVPKSEHSREIMLPRSPAVLAQSGMEALVAAGVVAPEAAGRALLACWTSVHGLASLAVTRPPPARRRADARGRTRRRAADRDARRGRRSCAVPARAPAARAAPARAWPSSCASRPPRRRAREDRSASPRDASRPLARRAALHHSLGAQAARLRAAGRARGAGRVPGARAAGAECVQLGAVALRRRHRAGDPGKARRVLRDGLGRLSQGDRGALRRGRRLAGARLRAVPRRPLPRSAGDGASVPRSRAPTPAPSGVRRVSTARSSRPPGASSWPRAREGSARAGRRSTWDASATPPRSSASRTTASSRSR